MALVISMSPKKVSAAFTVVVVMLTLASIAAQLHEYVFHLDWLPSWAAEELMLDEESNIPTWYASSALIFSTALLALITYSLKIQGGRYIPHWVILTLVFMYISVDESASLHEHIGRIADNIGASGLLSFAWVIPASAIGFILGAGYLRFLFHLPKLIRNLFLAGAALFIGGAIGVEMVSAYYYELDGNESILYQLTSSVEEVMEMTGVIVFNYGLMRYLGSYVQDARLLRMGSRERGAAMVAINIKE